MDNDHAHTAVGAGTTAGDARDEALAPESRAAEAEVDARLESLQVTGAGIPEATATGHGPQRTGLRAEQPRGDLRNNQAGIAGRLDGTEPER
jgi:hypothetical protein